MAWFRFALAAGLALLCLAGSAAADGDTIAVKVLVTQVSNDGGGVDVKARGLHENLKRHSFSFDSVRVIYDKRVVMKLDEVRQIPLPGGRTARISPISPGEGSVLMAVDVEGSVKVDARVRSHKPFIIRAGRHKGGNLVMSLELDE